ncbi:MAG: PhzF family phenazine biosynthesis protein [Defluviitaleaceae bacterium]|nr:PhzF family phenazine biosynthesis protein [Defluviitaleaceae bacterium]MCL2835476.1 PhzF family phenazine biosynthesis protein [Defluviitaleaceae bacterium]
MKYFIADAFTNGAFTGNPAGVCLLEHWIDNAAMQNIAAENNLAETAFLVKSGPGAYDLKWFTPMNEVDLCGHATLAAAFVVMNYAEKELDAVKFSTVSGLLGVKRRDDLYVLDFPSRKPVPVKVAPEMSAAVGADVLEAYGSRDLVLVVSSEKEVRELDPDMRKIEAFSDYLGVCVTARGDKADFVSRFFAPLEGIPEDPVTGSAHCNLIPLWAEKLGKTEMTAMQLSKRGGTLFVRDKNERVEIAGKARLYLEGVIFI